MIDDRYSHLRDRIRTGDCVLWRTRGLVPSMIRLWSEYTHASLVVRLDEYEGLRHRVFLVEALRRGLTLTLLSHRLSGTRGGAWLFQPDGLGDDQIAWLRASALVNAARQVRYDFKGLLANVLGRVSVDARRYFCSEHVWHEWDQAGLLMPDVLTETGFRQHERGKAPRPGDIPRWIRGTLLDLRKPVTAKPRKDSPCH
jgi:hypothetical protein